MTPHNYDTASKFKPETHKQKTQPTEIEEFEGGISSNKKGFRLAIKPNLTFSVLIETVESENGKEYDGIECAFSQPDENSENQHVIAETVLKLRPDIIAEENVEEFMRTVESLIEITGVGPQYIVKFFSQIDHDKLMEKMENQNK